MSELQCEFKDSCEKHSEFCFNEYVDACATRTVLKLNHSLIKLPKSKEEFKTIIKQKFGYLDDEIEDLIDGIYDKQQEEEL